MKHYLIILLLTLVIIKTKGQNSSKCNCEALVDFNYKGQIIVYYKPNGHSIKSLQHNFKGEDYLVLTINNDSLNFFYVDISYALTENSNTMGWIKKINAIGTYTSNYSPSDTLFLYSKPDLKSKVQSIIPDWTNQLYTISKCFGKWVYVKIKYKGQLKQGWLEPGKQCSNPYTTCS